MLKTFNENDFNKYLEESEPVVKILPPSAWKQQIIDRFKNGRKIQGAMLPWRKTHDLIRFRGGEVTLWQGMSGHGKSQVLGQACIGFAAQGEPACFASFEMMPESTGERLFSQMGGMENPSESYLSDMIDWCDGKIWVYDHLGSIQPEKVYAAIRYSAAELGCKHFIVDNLMKCVRGEDDLNGQKSFVDKLTALAKEYRIHVHIVHHVRKGANEYEVPNKFDARGSGTIVDQVDQMLTVWRNKLKEDKLEKNPEDREEQVKPDCLLVCQKHRHGEWEGKITLWYKKNCYFYCPDDSYRTYDIRNERFYQ